MCEKCPPIPKVTPEVEAKLKRAQELCEELEGVILDIMLPTTLEKAPGYSDIQARVTAFFNASIEATMQAATARVMATWPDQVEDSPAPTASDMLEQFNARIADAMAAQTGSQVIDADLDDPPPDDHPTITCTTDCADSNCDSTHTCKPYAGGEVDKKLD